MKKDEEPKLWVTVLKLFVGAVVIIGGVGLVLNWALKLEQSSAPDQGSIKGWGISSDSPLRSKR